MYKVGAIETKVVGKDGDRQMQLSRAQQLALDELNLGSSICLGCGSLTYERHEIIAEGLQVVDFKLLSDTPAFLARCDEVVIEWLHKHSETIEMMVEEFEQRQAMRELSKRFDGAWFKDHAA